MDLELCKTISSSRLNEYESKGYDDEDLDKLRQFYETAQQLIDEKAAKEAAKPPLPACRLASRPDAAPSKRRRSTAMAMPPAA